MKTERESTVNYFSDFHKYTIFLECRCVLILLATIQGGILHTDQLELLKAESTLKTPAHVRRFSDPV